MVKKLICVSRGLLAVLVLGPVLMRYEKALWKMCICKEAFLWNINNKKKGLHKISLSFRLYDDNHCTVLSQDCEVSCGDRSQIYKHMYEQGM